MDVVLDLDSKRLNTCIVPTGNSNKRQGGDFVIKSSNPNTAFSAPWCALEISGEKTEVWEFHGEARSSIWL